MTRQAKKRQEKKELEILLGHKPTKYQLRKWRDTGILPIDRNGNIDTTVKLPIDETVLKGVTLNPTSLPVNTFPTEIPDYLVPIEEQNKPLLTKIKKWFKR